MRKLQYLGRQGLKLISAKQQGLKLVKQRELWR